MRRTVLTSVALAALAASTAMPAEAGDCRCSRTTRHTVVRSAPTFDAVGHQTNFMQRQGFRTCSQVLVSCRRGATTGGITGRLAYSGVCEDRYRLCLKTGTWSTTNTGTVDGLARQ